MVDNSYVIQDPNLKPNEYFRYHTDFVKMDAIDGQTRIDLSKNCLEHYIINHESYFAWFPRPNDWMKANCQCYDCVRRSIFSRGYWLSSYREAAGCLKCSGYTAKVVYKTRKVIYGEK